MRPFFVRRINLAGILFLVVLTFSHVRLAAATVEDEFSRLYSSGKTQYEAGEYSAALELLSRAAELKPNDIGVNFYHGLAASRSGDFEMAVIDFEHVLTIDPTLSRVKAELGRSYYELGQYDLAEPHFRDLIEEDLPKNVRVRVERYLEAIERQTKRHFFSARATFSVSRDTNIRVSPADDTVATVLGDVVLDDTYQENRDIMYSTTFGVDHTFRFSSRNPWLWQSSLTQYNALYDTEKDLDLNYFYAATGPAYRNGRYSLGIQATYGSLERDYDTYLRTFGGALTGSYVVNDSMAAVADIRIEDRKYYQSPGRDGMYYRAGIGPVVVFGKNRVSCQVGMEGLNADDRVEAYDCFFAGVSAERDLGAGFTAFAKYQFKTGEYEEDDPLFADRREDDEHEVAVGIRKVIMENVTASLVHTYTDVDSTIELYEYHRNVTNLSLTVGF